MMCPCCGQQNGGEFNELCPRCKVWMASRRRPDKPAPVGTGGTTRQILNIVAHATGRLRKIQQFVGNLHW